MQSFDAESIRRSYVCKLLNVRNFMRLSNTKIELHENQSRACIELPTIGISRDTTIEYSCITGNIIVRDGCKLTLDRCFLIHASIKGNYKAKDTFTDTPIGDIPMMMKSAYDEFYEKYRGSLCIGIDGPVESLVENTIYDRKTIAVGPTTFERCAFFHSRFSVGIDMHDKIKFEECVYIDDNFCSTWLKN